MDKLIDFNRNIDTIELPKRFTFPFYYEPHLLCEIAAQELQAYILDKMPVWQHNFGLEESREGMVIGKMFGVLVVQKADGQLAYLAAVSGKLANSNHHERLVPPVFDMLTEGSFFKEEEEVLNQYNREIDILEQTPTFAEAKKRFKEAQQQSEEDLAKQRTYLKQEKKKRKQQRQESEPKLSTEAFEELKEKLKDQSLEQQYYYKQNVKAWKEQLEQLEHQVNHYQHKIDALKKARKDKSSALQKRLFNEYSFLNQEQQSKSLEAIFKDTILHKPPAGAGECAAPKLLQYAFKYGLKPISMAEFWWGASPKSAVRKHKHYYPACRGKCEPILKHMLEGIEMDENPMMTNPAEGKELVDVYEDEAVLIVNKPAEFLSVPGKNVEDSVFFRVKKRYPHATGPLLVHRLDMSTSGLILIAKSKEVHKELQKQFIQRTVKKRYVALLDGVVEGNEGTIDLPLRVDLDNRPQQLVCYEYGKAARTIWEVKERRNQQTLVHFYPVTGRTHQLRVHAAHSQGLNCPIVGDDLYGKKGERLHLHAAYLKFEHPLTREWMEIEVEPSF